MLTELSFTKSIIPPKPTRTEQSLYMDAFQNSEFKFALQKNGELTDISLDLLQRSADINLTDLVSESQRRLFTTVNDIGIALARNKAICGLVASGAVDAGIVGLDQVYESGHAEDLVILRDYREVGQWDIVLATPVNKNYLGPEELLFIATQYPAITGAFFTSLELNPTIITTQGSTEVMPLLTYNGNVVDGIVDLKVSGKTLDANGMMAWNPPITQIYPVLVTNNNAINPPTTLRSGF